MKKLTKVALARLIKRADNVATDVNAWLDSFPEGKMTAEAAAFMDLLNGVEEIR